jgi:hypothetical protein
MSSARPTIRRSNDELPRRTYWHAEADALDIPSGYYDPDSAAYDDGRSIDLPASGVDIEATETRELVTA